jgi:Uma2 family endonuclease
MTATQVSKQLPIIRTRRFSSDEFGRMVEAGILAEDERLELLRGEIISMTPIGKRHAACINRLTLLLGPLLASRQVIVSVQNPIHLDNYSEPQPDLVVARFRPDAYEDALPAPADILLLVEVTDSSDEYDRAEKLPLYSQFGISEVWLVRLNPGVVESFRTPSPEGYRVVHTYTGKDRFSPAGLPAFSLSVSDLLPERS